MYKARWKRMHRYIKKQDADAFVVRIPSNIRYLLVTHLSTSSLATHLIFFSDGDMVALVPALEAERARKEAAHDKHHVFGNMPGVEVDSKTMAMGLKKLLGRKKVRKALCDTPEKVKGVKFLADDIITHWRTIKAPEEIALIKKAVAITDKAGSAIPRIVRPGVSEKIVAAELNYIMRREGADELGFTTIVAAGPNSAYPHHDNSDYRIRKGDPVTMDFGAIHLGYTADMTRTVFAGGRPASKDLSDIYNAVLEAQQKCINAVRPGIAAGMLDRVARDIIIEHGYGKYYVHSTGHGMGLDVHEFPRLSPGIKDRVKKGMVFTVEPGIYVPGVGGVRIEDDVYIGDRVQVLNRTRIERY